MRLRRSSYRDPSREEWSIQLLDKYGRSIERHEFRGTRDQAKRKAARMLAGEYLKDNLVHGIVVRPGNP